MADQDDSNILIGAKFDLKGLEKDIKSLAKIISQSLGAQLKNGLDLSGILKGIKVELDFSFAQKQIDDFAKGNKLSIPVELKQNSSAKGGGKTVVPTTKDVNLVPQIKDAEVLKGLYNDLIKEVDQYNAKGKFPELTQGLTKVKNLYSQLRDLQDKEVREGILTDKDAQKFTELAQKISRATEELADFETEIKDATPELKRLFALIDPSSRLTTAKQTFGFDTDLALKNARTLGGQLRDLTKDLKAVGATDAFVEVKEQASDIASIIRQIRSLVKKEDNGLIPINEQDITKLEGLNRELKRLGTSFAFSNDEIRKRLPSFVNIITKLNPLSGTERTKRTENIPDNLDPLLNGAKNLQTNAGFLKDLLPNKNAFPLLNQISSRIKAIITELDQLNKKKVEIGLSDKDVKKVDDLNTEINDLTRSYDLLKDTVKGSAPTLERGIQNLKDIGQVDKYFGKGFSFNVGIIGFGLQQLGSQFTNVAQGFSQFVQSSAQATEPIERVRNLLDQMGSSGELAAEKIPFILEEVNRLADIPGASLDSVTDGFRKLNAGIGDTEKSLKLLEGLTKATGRSGAGAAGLTQIAESLAKSQEGFEQDRVNTLIQQGGKDVTDILRKTVGLTAEELNKAGFDKVVNSLIKGLEKLPTPLFTTQDRLKNIENSFTRIRASLGDILDRGLTNLLGLVQKIEKSAEELGKRFKDLPEATKDFIGNLAVGVPIVLALVGGIFSMLGSLALVVAVFKQLSGLVTAVSAYFSLGATAAEGIGVAATTAGTAISGLLLPIALVAAAIASIGIAFYTNFLGIADLVKGAFGFIFTSFGELFGSIGELLLALEPIGALLLFIAKIIGTVILAVVTGLALILGLLAKITASLFGNVAKGVKNFFKFFGYGYDDVTKVNDAIDETGTKTKSATEEAEEFKKQLEGSVKVSRQLSDIINKLIISTAKLNQQRDRSLQQLENDTLDQQSDQDLDSLILTDPLKAQQTFRKTLEESYKRATEGIKQTYSDLQSSQAEALVNTLNDSITNRNASSNIIGQVIGFNQDSIVPLIDGLKLLASQGKTAGKEFNDLKSDILDYYKTVKQFNEAGVFDSALQVGKGKIPGFNKESLKKELDQVVQEGTDIQKAIEDIEKSNNNKTLDLAKAKRAFNQDIIKRTKQIDDAVKKLDAARQSTKLKQDLDVINQQIEKQTKLVNDLTDKGRLTDAERAQSSILDLRKEAVVIEKQIADINNIQKDAITFEQNNQDRILKNSQNQLKNDQERLEILDKINEKTKEGYDLAIKGIEEYLNSLTEIRTFGDEDLINSGGAQSVLSRITKAKSDQETNTRGRFDSKTEQSLYEAVENSVASDSGDSFATVNNLLEKAKLLRASLSLGNDPKFIAQASEFFNKLSGDVSKLYEKAEQKRRDLVSLQEQRAKATSKEEQDRLDAEIETAKRQYAVFGVNIDAINKLEQIGNSILVEKNRRLNQQTESRLRNLRIVEATLKREKELLDLRGELLSNQISNSEDRAGRDPIGDAQQGGMEERARLRTQQRSLDIAQINQEYEIEEKRIEQEKERLSIALLLNDADIGETNDALESLDRELEIREKIRATKTQAIIDAKDAEELQKFKEGLQSIFDFGVSGQGITDSLINIFKKLSDGIKGNLDIAGAALETFKQIGTTAITGFFSVFADSLAQGENPLKNFKKFLGEMLVTIGTALIQLGAAALAVGLVRFLFGDVTAPALGAVASVAAIGAGTGLIVLGKALGGGDGGATKASDDNASSSASNKAGVSNIKEEYDAEKDPKLIYQKALAQQIIIDIKTDSAQIIKVVAKQVNRDPRFRSIVGNGATNFS